MSKWKSILMTVIKDRYDEVHDRENSWILIFFALLKWAFTSHSRTAAYHCTLKKEVLLKG